MQKMFNNSSIFCPLINSFQSETIITDYLLSFINISTIDLADKSLTMLAPNETLIANDFITVLTFIKGVLNLSTSVAN